MTQIAEAARRSRPASWVDRITASLDRLRLPLWLTYAVIFAIPPALIVATGGGPLPLERYPYYFLAGFWTVFPLGLMHHLDRFAGRALDQFRPACDLDEKEAEDLRWHLTTMPAAPAALAGLAGVLFVGTFYFVAPQMFQVIQASRAQFIVGMVDLALNFALVGALTYHTVRQLRLVSAVYERARRLDLFNLSPLYAFASLTARTSIAWALAIYLSAVLYPEITRNPVSVGVTVLQAGLLVAVFTLPLVGIHRRIVAAKEKALGDVGGSLKRALDEINGRSVSLRLDDMDALNKLVTALIAGREALAKVPTWPWSPGTPVAVVSALLLPVALFVIERLMAGFLGL